MKVTKILTNKYVLKSLEKISEHGTSFAAGTSLVLSLSLRPFAINKTPNTEKENRQYAMANSICSGLMKFALVEAVALPIEHAVKKIDKNKAKYLTDSTLKNLPPRAYKFLTQITKLTAGLLTAIPKSVMTIALVPIAMDKILKNKEQKTNIIQKNNATKDLTFTANPFTKPVAGVINNKFLQKFAIKYQNKDKDIAKHITAGTDILLTATSAYQINNSKNIKENRKKALIYNNIIATAITLVGGYLIDAAAKNKTDKFIDKFKQLNYKDPKLTKYIEGINILRPAIIFAGIYYGILPMFSTFIAERVDKAINKNAPKLRYSND